MVTSIPSLSQEFTTYPLDIADIETHMPGFIAVSCLNNMRRSDNVVVSPLENSLSLWISYCVKSAYIDQICMVCMYYYYDQLCYLVISCVNMHSRLWTGSRSTKCLLENRSTSLHSRGSRSPGYVCGAMPLSSQARGASSAGLCAESGAGDTPAVAEAHQEAG